MSFEPSFACPDIVTACRILEAIYAGAKVRVTWADVRAWCDDDEVYISIPTGLISWAVLRAPLDGLTEDDLGSEKMFGDQFCGTMPTFVDMTEGNA